jgi:DNA polymerase
LGATAAQALAGRPIVLVRERGRLLDLRDGYRGFVTVHPSAVLRMRDEVERQRAFAELVADLRKAVASDLPEPEAGA